MEIEKQQDHHVNMSSLNAGKSYLHNLQFCWQTTVRAGDAVHPQPGSYFPAGSAYGLAKIEAAPGIMGFVTCQIYDNARLVAKNCGEIHP